MEDAIKELASAILKTQNNIDWTAIISAVCSVISLVTIVILLIERIERKRPYLQATFELVKSNLVCIVIRNTGEVTAKLKEICFSENFVKQLPKNGQYNAQNNDHLNISIHPNQKWVLYLGVITPEVMHYEDKRLEITLKYSKYNHKKLYSETETINFEDYNKFLVYISEVDELKEEIKKLTKGVNDITKELKKISKIENNTQTQNYGTIENSSFSTVVTSHNGEGEVSSMSGEKIEGKSNV